MKQNRAIYYRYRRNAVLAGMIASLLLTSPALTGGHTASAAGRQIDRMISRIDEKTDTGLVHSHFETADGDGYCDPAADTTRPSKLKKTPDLPTRYDLREHNLTTSIKDQGATGCCWAFSAIKVIESNCIKNGLFDAGSTDFSESHLAWYSYHPATSPSDPTYNDGILSATVSSSSSFPDPFAYGSAKGTIAYDNGGSAILANFTLAKWCGAEYESAAPFTGANSEQIASMAYNMQINTDLRYDSYAHLQNVYNFDEYTLSDQYYYTDSSIIPKMKQAILDYGAMSTSLYYDKAYLHTSASGSAYYQNHYAGVQAVKQANHSVTIVGWDDNFAASDFSRTPPGNGAWLIANSYGTSSGDTGYFWLSYYDQSICDCSSFLMESSSNYDNIYQYDGFGWGTANYSNSADLKAANIFKAESTSNQKLRAVSFYTLTNNQPYRIEVYRNIKSGPTDGIRIDSCTTEGTAAQNGYHTVTLNTPVTLDAGERFSVVVTYRQKETGKIYVPLEGRDSSDSSLSICYGSRLGESFLFTKLSSKSSDSTIHWLDTAALGYHNVCVKAFADDTTDPSDPLPSVTKTITLGRGETFQLPQGYTYTSNDPSLATVNASGKVKTRRKGKTTILASDADGTSGSLYRFVIKKAPSGVKIKPAKKTIKKGKHLKLKVKLSSGSASRRITFRSSRPGVARVSKTGRITARRKGSTTIRVKTYNGHTASMKLTVIR